MIQATLARLERMVLLVQQAQLDRQVLPDPREPMAHPEQPELLEILAQRAQQGRQVPTPPTAASS